MIIALECNDSPIDPRFSTEELSCKAEGQLLLEETNRFAPLKASMNAMQGTFNIEGSFENCKNIRVDTITVYGAVWEPFEVTINNVTNTERNYSRDLGRLDIFQVDTDLCNTEAFQVLWKNS